MRDVDNSKKRPVLLTIVGAFPEVFNARKEGQIVMAMWGVNV